MGQLQRTVKVDADNWSLRGQLRLVEWLVANYPRPNLTSTWLTLEPVVALAEQLGRAWEQSSLVAAVSGEVAADALAPYENPTRLLVYSASQIDLSADGLRPSPPSASNVQLAKPDDPFVLRQPRLTNAGYRVIDPWRIVVDLTQAGSEQAAAALTEALQDRRIPG